MKKICLFLLFNCVLVVGFTQSKYDHRKAFAPDFYSVSANEFRSASGEPGPKYWQNRADYKLACTLDTGSHSVNGTVEINYTNNSPDNLRFLWLQLDQNIFADQSIMNQTSTGAVKDSIPASFFGTATGITVTDYKGGYTIKSVKDVTGKNLPYIINNTMMRIDLPVALKTGDKFSFSVDWSYTEYNRQVFDGRGGYEFFPEDGNYVYTFAQWFPRMCVYDDYEGWQNKQFLGQGEFALTFGNYSVKITVPSDHIVGATGTIQNPKAVLTKEQ